MNETQTPIQNQFTPTESSGPPIIVPPPVKPTGVLIYQPHHHISRWWSLLIVFVAVAAVGYWAWTKKDAVQYQQPQQNLNNNFSLINSFQACAAAGYPIMESYPEKCRTPDGLTFTKNYGGCIQVIQSARNPVTGEIREFPTPCDVPEGWQEEENI